MLTLLLGIILGALIYYKLIKPSKYWEEKGITHVPSWPIIGNMGAFLTRKKHFLDIAADIYKNFPNERYVGYMQFSTPVLLIKDLDLIKQIGVKEFDHFHDHLGLTNTARDPLLSKSLLNLKGDTWKQMRATLSPAFTSSKMRNMYHLIGECAENFAKCFEGKGQVEVEMKDVLTRFTNDVIASAAFGIQVNSIENPKHEFYAMVQKLTKVSVVQVLKNLIVVISSTLANILRIQLLPDDVVVFFRSIILNNIDRRTKEGIIRPDLIHLLMEARKGRLTHDTTHNDNGEGFATVEESQIGRASPKMELTDDDIVAQALLFFFAGFDTVSTASCFMALELAIYPDVQKKLQDEIDAVNQEHNGKIPYEAILSMKYLDQVISETLRRWPPAFQTDRLCTREFKIEPKNPNEKALLVEKGVDVTVPITSLHYDPRYFSHPDRFDPERFNDENKAKILPGTYLPFGIGPRNCIGSRFALLEMKTLFFHLLSKFDLIPVDKTEIPIKISPKNANLAPENGFHLGFKPREI
jgi:cytochrome P450 family 9